MVYATKLQVANHQKIDDDKLILAANSDCSVTKISWFEAQLVGQSVGNIQDFFTVI